jgi:hypothetical protein
MDRRTTGGLDVLANSAGMVRAGLARDRTGSVDVKDSRTGMKWCKFPDGTRALCRAEGGPPGRQFSCQATLLFHLDKAKFLGGVATKNVLGLLVVHI